MIFTALIPHMIVVFPSFTRAEPSAVEIDPEHGNKEGKKSIEMTENTYTQLTLGGGVGDERCASPMFSVVALNSVSSRPSGRQFSF